MGGVESSEKKEEKPVTDTRDESACKEWKRRYLGHFDDGFFGKDNVKTKKAVLEKRPTSATSEKRTTTPDGPHLKLDAKESSVDVHLGKPVGLDDHGRCSYRRTKTDISKCGKDIGASKSSSLALHSAQNDSKPPIACNKPVHSLRQIQKTSNSKSASQQTTKSCRGLAPSFTFATKSSSGEVQRTNKGTQETVARSRKQVMVVANSASATKSKTSVTTAIAQNINRVHPFHGNETAPASVSKNAANSASLTSNVAAKGKQQCSKSTVKLAPTWNASPSSQTTTGQHTQQRQSTVQQQGISACCSSGTNAGKQRATKTEAKSTISTVSTTDIKLSKIPRPTVRQESKTPMPHDKSTIKTSNTSGSQMKHESKTVAVHKSCSSPCSKQTAKTACQKLKMTGNPSAPCRQQPAARQQSQQIMSKTQSSASKQGQSSVIQTPSSHILKSTILVTKQNGTPQTSSVVQQKVSAKTSKIHAEKGKAGTPTNTNQTKGATKQKKLSHANEKSQEDMFMMPIQQLTKFAAKHFSDFKNSNRKPPPRKLKPSAKKITKPLQAGEIPVCFLIKEHYEEFAIGLSDDEEDDEDENEELETLLRAMLSNKILGWNAFQGLLYRYYRGKAAPRKEYPRLASCTNPSQNCSSRVKIMSEVAPEVKMTKKQRKRKAKNKARDEKETGEIRPTDSVQTQMEKILYSDKPEEELQKSNMAKPHVESAMTESITDMLKIDIDKPVDTVCAKVAGKRDQQPSVIPKTNHVKEEKTAATKVQPRSKRKAAKHQEKQVESILNLNQQLADKLTGTTTPATPVRHSGTSDSDSSKRNHKVENEEGTHLSVINSIQLIQPAPNAKMPQPASKRLATGDASSNRQGSEINNKSEKSDKSSVAASTEHSTEPSKDSTTLKTTSTNTNSNNISTGAPTCSTTASTFSVPNATFTPGTSGPTTTSSYLKSSKGKQGKSIHARRFGKISSDEENNKNRKPLEAEKDPPMSEEIKKDAKKIVRRKKITEVGGNGKIKFKVKRRILEKTKTKLGLTNLDDIRFCRACADTKQRDGKPLIACTKCDDVFYCSRQCQQDDWDGHKIFCKGFRSKCNRCHTFQKKILNVPASTTTQA